MDKIELFFMFGVKKIKEKFQVKHIVGKIQEVTVENHTSKCER